MNHLEAIDIGLRASRSHNEIVRKIFLTYPTCAFNGKEEVQFEILNAVALELVVPITAVQVAGSAKLGVSIHKNTDFSHVSSDLDLAIIDGALFTKYLEIGLRISKGYSDGTVFQAKSGVSVQPEYLKYLTRGIFRPDLMPMGPPRANWANFFGQLSTKYSKLFKSISCAIYLSQSCFESKQRSIIKAHAQKGLSI